MSLLLSLRDGVKKLLLWVHSWLRRTIHRSSPSTRMIEPQSGSTSSTIATAVISDGEQTPSRSNVAGQSEWYEIISGPDLEQGDVLPNLSAPRAIQDDDAPGGY